MWTRFIRLTPTLLALLVLGGTEAYAQTATVVMQSRQRITGEVVGMNTDNGPRGNRDAYSDAVGSVLLRTNGRDRQIPAQDVAFIDFAGNGNVSQNEIDRANQSSDGFIVFRNGRTMAGRVVDFQTNNQVVVQGPSGERTIPLNQVARVYFGSSLTAADRRGYGNDGRTYPYGNGNPNINGNNRQNRPPFAGTSRTVTIPTDQAWSNSGVDVRRGDVVRFRASGSVSLSHNDGDTGTPAGASSGRLAGNSPLPGVAGGMLIGRVGSSQPFAIGSESDVTMPATGRLFLGVNDDVVSDNSGTFVVEVRAR